MRRPLLAIAALACAGVMLASAAVAATLTPRASGGGTLRLNFSASDFAYLDPALAYDGPSWQLLFATGATLVGFPNASGPRGTQLAPDAAQALPRISRDGRTYTFTLRKGLRFSDGSAVTPAAFVRAFERAANPKQQSPANQYVGDLAGVDAYIAGKADRIAGLAVKGSTLVVRLARPRPTFLSEVALPFFQAVKPSMAIDPDGINVYPSAGAYRIVSREPGVNVVLERNRFYRGKRPARVDRMVITVNTDTSQSLLQVRAGQADYDLGGLPPTAHSDLSSSYGVRKAGKGRYFVNPTLGLTYLALNTARPFFADVRHRKALNWAIDRPALLRVGGKLAGTRTDQIIPPSIPGFRQARLYAIKGADPAMAKRVSPGISGTVRLLHTTSPTSTARAQVIQYNLRQIGVEVKLDPQPFGVAIRTAGTRGSDFDMFLISWASDYPDPSVFINPLLDGRLIQEENNSNYSYWNDEIFNRRMSVASRLAGDARFAAFGQLDVDIMRQAAPLAPILTPNVREFVSARTTGYVFHPVYQAADLSLLSVGR
jgi:peptide/nickel transport system substrate-binding protein